MKEKKPWSVLSFLVSANLPRSESEKKPAIDRDRARSFAFLKAFTDGIEEMPGGLSVSALGWNVV